MSERHDKKELGFRMVASIWVATVVIICLILLLAITIQHKIEEGMVEQSGRQQMAIAKEKAGRIEELLRDIERRLVILSRLPSVKKIRPDDTAKSIRVIFNDLEGKVKFIARLDEKGDVLIVHPEGMVTGRFGHGLQYIRYFEEIERTGKPYISDLIMLELVDDKGKKGISKAIIIGVPKYNDDFRFTGVVLAALPLETLVNDYFIKGDTRILHDTWMIDHNGTLLVHPGNEKTGMDVSILEKGYIQGKFSLKEKILKERAGYGEFVLSDEDARGEKHVVAYAPVDFTRGVWFLAVSTRYRAITSVIRRAFVNTMMGTGGLIVVILLAGSYLTYESRKKLQLREELKRITERSEWQEKLLREKKTIEGIIEGFPIPTFVINKNHEVILWNRACTELTGYEARDMIGTNRHYLPFYADSRPLVADLIIDQDLEGMERYYGEKKARKSEKIEGAYESRDYFENLGGKPRHLYFLAAPIYDEKGEMIEAIETLQDISKEIAMSKKIKAYANNLQEELDANIRLREEVESLYAYLQSIIDSSPDRLYELDADGMINYVSGDLKRGAHLVSPRFKGKHFMEFVAPEHREVTMENWMGLKQGVFNPYEIEARAKDGTKRNLLITPTRVKGTDRYLFVQRDITEFKNLEKKFYESQKLAAVGQLSAGIAHEVRNPLSSIKMSLQILEKRMNPEGNDLKRFRIAQREVEHLESLVNDVLIYAKPLAPKKEMADLQRVLERSLHLCERHIKDKEIRVKTSYDEDFPLLFIDTAMVEQALINLYRNAVDAMEKGGVLSITVRQLNRENPEALIEISDNGSGIAEEDMIHLFNPFFTKKQYGTGLGLTQVKKIIELHGGTIDVASEKGRGTEVRISLPVSEHY
ncbi:MAG: PAS domain S-box protein [Deltaproteobacteria bacterium]|nr:PAS domain S-box protein [Deltaproteobacteria bacterium]